MPQSPATTTTVAPMTPATHNRAACMPTIRRRVMTEMPAPPTTSARAARVWAEPHWFVMTTILVRPILVIQAVGVFM